jgi:predicted nucleic acid-binding protein
MTSQTKTRLVFDSVFYFSLGLGGKIATKIWEIVLSQDNIELCLSSTHFNEIKAKFYGEEMREILSEGYDENLMSQICAKIAASHTHFYPQIEIDLCLDGDDNFLLELAKEHKFNNIQF